MDSFRFLDASLNKLSTRLKFFPSLDANGIKNKLSKGKPAYPFKKGNTIELFYKPLKIGREGYFSTLKESYPDFEVIIRTQDLL